MTNDRARFQRIEELYHAARAQPIAVRADFLARATENDESLRREVESLLAHASTTDGFLEALLPDDSAASAHVAPGDMLGPYTILEFIGAGGMGEVYRARDPRLQRDVAIKVLPSQAAAPRHQQRLLAEAQAAGALNHPNILTVYDVGTHHDAPFIVSELLRGETLRQRLARGPLAESEARAVATEIVRGLIAAHAEGIVHRDLKPENVFVTADGRIKILDFGLATRTRVDDEETGVAPRAASKDSADTSSSAGAVGGTLGYMSPEQRRGKNVDQRADVFAFGALLHELVTGRSATERDSSGAIDPGSLLGIAYRCLRADPDARFQSARALSEALADVSTAQVTRDVAPPSRRRAFIIAAGVGVAALILISGRSTLTRWRETPAITVSAPANEAYQRGRFFLGKATEADIKKAITYFRQASAADPTYALPQAGLADAYTALRSVYAAPDTVMPSGRTAAMRAIALDPSLADAHVSMGGVLMYYDFDWTGAEREFRRAIELSPRLASAHQGLSLLLAALGRHAEARAAMGRARDLDPLSLQILCDAGWVAYLARDFIQAEALNHKAIELDAAFWPSYRDLGLAYEKQGRFPEAISVLQKARSLDANSTVLEMLGGAYAAAGDRFAARRVLEDLDAMEKRQYVCPYKVATVHAGLGDAQATMEWLEKGYRHRADCMPWVAADPKLDALRALPRFQELMRKMGLGH